MCDDDVMRVLNGQNMDNELEDTSDSLSSASKCYCRLGIETETTCSNENSCLSTHSTVPNDNSHEALPDLCDLCDDGPSLNDKQARITGGDGCRTDTTRRKIIDHVNDMIDTISKDEVQYQSEMDLFSQVTDWLLSDNNHATFASEVLSHVRFGLLSDVDLLQYFRNDHLLSSNIDDVLKGVAYQRSIKSGFSPGIYQFSPNPRVYLAACHGTPRRTSSKQADEQQLLLQLRERAAATIQRAFRTRRVQLTNRLFLLAVLVIQCSWRAYRNRVKVVRENEAAARIQSAWRGRVARREVMVMHLAIVIIQTWWRRWMRREQFLVEREAAIVIQCAWRRHCTNCTNCPRIC